MSLPYGRIPSTESVGPILVLQQILSSNKPDSHSNNEDKDLAAKHQARRKDRIQQISRNNNTTPDEASTTSEESHYKEKAIHYRTDMASPHGMNDGLVADEGQHNDDDDDNNNDYDDWDTRRVSMLRPGAQRIVGVGDGNDDTPLTGRGESIDNLDYIELEEDIEDTIMERTMATTTTAELGTSNNHQDPPPSVTTTSTANFTPIVATIAPNVDEVVDEAVNEALRKRDLQTIQATEVGVVGDDDGNDPTTATGTCFGISKKGIAIAALLFGVLGVLLWVVLSEPISPGKSELPTLLPTSSQRPSTSPSISIAPSQSFRPTENPSMSLRPSQSPSETPTLTPEPTLSLEPTLNPTTTYAPTSECQLYTDIDCFIPFYNESCQDYQYGYFSRPCTHRPEYLVLEYNGGGCDQSLNTQPRDYFDCVDFGVGPGPPSALGSKSYIVVEELRGSAFSEKYFEGFVRVGEVFNVTSVLGSLDREINIPIFDPHDLNEDEVNLIVQPWNQLQSVRFDSSCRHNLSLGDWFGSHRVVTFSTITDGRVSYFQPVKVTFSIVSLPSSSQNITHQLESLVITSDLEPYKLNIGTTGRQEIDSDTALPILFESTFVLDISTEQRYAICGTMVASSFSEGRKNVWVRHHLFSVLRLNPQFWSLMTVSG